MPVVAVGWPHLNFSEDRLKKSENVLPNPVQILDLNWMLIFVVIFIDRYYVLNL